MSVELAPLDSRILERPRIEQSIVEMKPEQERAPVNQPVGMEVSLRWRLGEDGYYKFFSIGAVLSLTDRQLSCTLTESQAKVAAYAVEPEREPYGGQLIMELQ